MKKCIQGYHLFVTSPLARWGLYLLYPLSVIAATYIIGYYSNPFLSLLFAMILICGIELVADHDIYGGLANQDTNKLEYLKTSCHGMDILLGGLVGDMIRRAISISLILIISFIQRITLTELVFAIFLLLFLVELGLLFCRMTHMLQMSFAVTSLCQIPIIWLVTLMRRYSIPLWCLLLCLILWLSTAFAGRYIIMRNARKSYYDS